MEDTSKREILGAINKLSASTEQRFDDVYEALMAFSEATDRRFDNIDRRFIGLETEMKSMNKRLNRVEALMVTKDYLDEKFSDFRGDVVQMIGRAIGKHETKFHAA